jgi:WD40 repeat protein
LLERYRPVAEGGSDTSDIPPLDSDDPRDFEWRYLWRLSRGATPALRVVEGFRGTLLGTAFSEDGKTLTAVDRTGLLKVIDANTGGERIRVDLRNTVPSDPPRQWTASCTAFSADGKMVALGTDEHGLVLCEVATGKEQRRVKMSEGIVRALAFSANGKSLAVGIGAGPQSGTIKLFSDVGAAEPQSLYGNEKDVVSLAFAPDGSSLASASLDGTDRVWDMITLKDRRIVEQQGDALRVLAFSRDSKWLAIASGARVTIHDTESGRTLRKLRRVRHPVAALAFSPTGRRLATAGADGVRLWDVGSGQEVLSLGATNDVISCLAFSADGQRLAAGRVLGSPSAVKGGEVRIWDASVHTVNR